MKFKVGERVRFARVDELEDAHDGQECEVIRHVTFAGCEAYRVKFADGVTGIAFEEELSNVK